MDQDHTTPDTDLTPEAAKALARRLGAVFARQRRQEARTCLRCGRTFIGTVRAQYCSASCRALAWQRRQPDYNARRRAKRQATDGA